MEIVQIVPKINQYLRFVKSDDLTFRKKKKVHEGYDFNEYGEINLIDDNLECLCYWPSNTEIDNAIKVGYEKAVYLAKYLEMTAISHDVHYFAIYKRLPTLRLEDFCDDNPKFKYTNDDEEINNDNLNISQSINCAVSKLSNQESQEEPNSSDLDVLSLLKKNYGTCQVIVEHIQKLPDILWYSNYPKDFDYLLNNGLLNIEHFLNLRQHHDAYLNRKLERKNILLKNYNNETDGEFDINKASGLVSYLTKNDSISIKSRENRWKSDGITNCNMHKKQNLLENLSCANVTTLFPLRVGSYVIAKFDNTLCIAQIIAMYEKKASMHSYIDTPISNLKSLSYISMKIYFHVNGAIFSEIHDYSFCIFSHVEPSHITYHLASKDISINEEALILKGNAKKTFNELIKLDI
ncbi:unnamed protein product [Rhizophagus irregularis]|nr:unnamed protein product [Rhizophagus irregularis]CAB4445036.1 unnamed protein product [Rhizophagus irregularis]